MNIGCHVVCNSLLKIKWWNFYRVKESRKNPVNFHESTNCLGFSLLA